MSHTPYDWRQYLRDRDADRRSRHADRRRDSEADTANVATDAATDIASDVIAWITAYLDNGASNDDDHGRDDRRTSGRTARTGRSDRRTRRLTLDDLFEDGDGPSDWPDELYESLAALRDRLHGISARQYRRRRGKHPRWGRRRDNAGDRNPEAHGHASGPSKRLIWATATRFAVLVITAIVARKRAERARRHKGFSV